MDEGTGILRGEAGLSGWAIGDVDNGARILRGRRPVGGDGE